MYCYCGIKDIGNENRLLDTDEKLVDLPSFGLKRIKLTINESKEQLPQARLDSPPLPKDLVTLIWAIQG